MPAKPGVNYAERYGNFERWFQTPLGQSLLADQQACVESLARALTGARQLQVGVSYRLPLATRTDFSQHIQTTPLWEPGLPQGVAVCDADELPFPSDSMDMVILHHSADFSDYPHQVVREASRVIRGGGKMLIIGFNPVSLWGMKKVMLRRRDGPWGGRFIFRRRMEDWLSLLDFQVDMNQSHFYRPPVQSLRLTSLFRGLERLGGYRFLPVGAYYCILATKRVCAPIVRRPLWRQRNVISLPAAGPLGVSRGYQRADNNAKNYEKNDV